MSGENLVLIKDIQFRSEKGQGNEVVLKEHADSPWYFQMFVGDSEFAALAKEKGLFSTPRPLTHETYQITKTATGYYWEDKKGNWKDYDEYGRTLSYGTRNGVVAGKVIRIDPAAREGTVTVDVAFTEELPQGARPDQNIDGTIQIDRLDDVLRMGRPVFGQADTTIGIFKLVKNGEEAIRIPVRLGRSSVTTIQVLEGLV